MAFVHRCPADSDLWDAISLEQAYDLIRMLDAEIYPRTYPDLDQVRSHLLAASKRSVNLHADVYFTHRD